MEFAPWALARPNLFRVGEWRGDRVVEGARLERVCAGNRTVGSNPTLSVIFIFFFTLTDGG